MTLKIINSEHMICACSNEDIPEWVTRYGKPEDVAFFYYHERDAIVLNEDNVNFGLYNEIIPVYLEFNDRQKKKFIDGLDDISIRAHKVILSLNYMIRIRRNLYKSLLRKARL